jgi:hypothetical protein
LAKPISFKKQERKNWGSEEKIVREVKNYKKCKRWKALDVESKEMPKRRVKDGKLGGGKEILQERCKRVNWK